MWETIRGISLILILSLFAISYIENSSDLRNKDIHWRWSKSEEKEELEEDNKVEESEEKESKEGTTEK